MAARKQINLALQGGGAHGAFTWGVLDRLLEDEALDLGWISAASAGAVNAVALAAGMAKGGRAGARAKLTEVWEAVHNAGPSDLLRMNPLLSAFQMSAAGVGRVLTPYQFNPMGIDPLRQLLADTIDFEAVRNSKGPELLIAATDIASGQPRFFRRHEMTIEAVLASACLPTIHHAVVIDDRAYWDGGFSSNPDLVHLALESPVGDTLIVLLNPTHRPGIPKTHAEIAAETGRLTFNAPLLRDVSVIEAVREAEGSWLQRRLGATRLSPLSAHRFHLIEAGRHTAALPAGSKLKPDWSTLSYLHQAGRDETYKWLDGHRSAIGQQSTVNLRSRFLEPSERVTVPAPGEGPQ